jgi:hypothetical protein
MQNKISARPSFLYFQRSKNILRSADKHELKEKEDKGAGAKICLPRAENSNVK